MTTKEAGRLSSPGHIFAMIRSGRASSRADIARLTGLAPSTVTGRVDALLAADYIVETGDGASRGGRRPRALEVSRAGRVVAGIDLGAQHASVAIFSLARGLLTSSEIPIDIADGPEPVLRAAHAEAERLTRQLDGSARLSGIGLAVPGPVHAQTGRIVSPSRMPGWNAVRPAEILRGIAHVETRVDNDANALALGEIAALDHDVEHLVLVKAGSSIGSSVVASGSIHRGFTGVAGDISHAAVHDAPPVLCTCGRLGCLDAVAGGAAIVRALRQSGTEVADTRALLGLARDAHPLATRLLREAGTRTGIVLATIVNFFNPQRLVLAGSLSSADAYVAGVRSTIYDLCLPMSTEGLDIRATIAGPLAGASGAAELILHHLLDPVAIDQALSDGRHLSDLFVH